jgi:hypothetical protein
MKLSEFIMELQKSKDFYYPDIDPEINFESNSFDLRFDCIGNNFNSKEDNLTIWFEED